MTGKSVIFRRDTGEPVGTSNTPINDIQDAISLMYTGQQKKKFAATAMNDNSSRSHTVLILNVNLIISKVKCIMFIL